jgi:class 3 adenylate cyclase
MGFAGNINEGNFNSVLFAVFTLTFLMVAVPLAVRYLPRETELARRRRLGRGPSDQEMRAALAADRDRKLRKSVNRLARKAIAEEEAIFEPAVAPEPEEKADKPAGEVERNRELDGREAEASDEPPPGRAGPSPDKSAEADPGPGLESRRSQIMRFLNGAVGAIGQAAPTLDSYNKFALHLYLAGAVDTMCDIQSAPDSERRKLTATALETLGTSPDLARKFFDKIGEYVLEQRYLKMLQAGRSAIEAFLNGSEVGAHVALKEAIAEWNRPAVKQNLVVTVMFTDMVGSTDLTQARGDAAAQEIVRRHNSIVRTAILQCDGKEVKHTGDGIMASFVSAAGAVDAAVAIQRNVAAHNTRMPAQELHLRIGLNAGEPIQEENDLFGSTVQLAARVCAATPTDGILCTGVVKDMAYGKGGAFRPAGSHNLKGFRDPVPLYEVTWAAP